MPNDLPLTRNQTRGDKARMRPLSLPEQIANQIGREILDGQFQPGDPLREQDLSDSYQVSRGPIREALRLLEMDGVVRILPNKGAQVTRLTAQEVSDIFEIRAALIAVSTLRLCAEMPEGLIGQASDLVAQMQAAAANEEPGAAAGAEFAQLSHQMSVMLMSATPNQRLSEMLLSLARQMMRYTRLGLGSVSRRQRSAQLWADLIAAMGRREGTQAAAAAQKLILESRDAAIAALKG